jgi:hypothetical protein
LQARIGWGDILSFVINNKKIKINKRWDKPITGHSSHLPLFSYIFPFLIFSQSHAHFSLSLPFLFFSLPSFSLSLHFSFFLSHTHTHPREERELPRERDFCGEEKEKMKRRRRRNGFFGHGSLWGKISSFLYLFMLPIDY